MEIQTNTPVLGIILKTYPAFEENGLIANSVINILEWPVCKHQNKISIKFENQLTGRDANYILKKKKQFKQKQFEKIFKGAVKLLKCYPNYWLGYLFAGASAFKCKKYEKLAIFYLSSAALVNPNCLSAWEGLQKYCRNDENINSDLFETVFMGYLINERSIDKWKNALGYVLNPDIPFFSKNPIKIIASLLKQDCYYDKDQKFHLANVISGYFFIQTKYMRHFMKYNSVIPDIALTTFFLYCDNNTGPDLNNFYTDAMLFLINTNAVSHLQQFILGTLESVRSLAFNPASAGILLTIIEHLVGNCVDPCCYISQQIIYEIAKAHPTLLRKRTSVGGFLIALLHYSFGDYTRVRNYSLKYLKDECWIWRLKLLQISSFIHLQDFEFAWTKLMYSVPKNIVAVNKLGMISEKESCALSHLELIVYLLTHTYMKSMQKLGLILCLKVIQMRSENVRILFYASIACIRLKKRKILTVCLHKLARLGAINEIIFLMAFKAISISTKTMYLKEIQHLRTAHLYSAIVSYGCESDKKAFKSFCKASVMVPDSVFLYEWLGIYAYENHDIAKSKMYFEIALFYNPYSWTSINYYASILALDNPNSSKLFLSLYKINGKSLPFQHIVNLKAGLSFFKFNPSKEDYFKACEYFRRCLKAQPNNRYFKEMLAESYSKFGMTGSGLKCFKECYITNNYRHLYSGSMIGRQYLFVKGIRKYLKMMKYEVNCGGLDVFIVLHNTAHAFLLKSIQLSSRYYYFLSQTYCQLALSFCVRAISISANYSSIWKLMGDILFQCSCLGYSAGFLYVPHWIFQGYGAKKIILVRRYQSALLAIRCYYIGLSTEHCSKEMMVCLWNSISVALRKLSSLSTIDTKQKLLKFGIQSSINSLQIDIGNSLTWNLLGIIINDQVLAVPSSMNCSVAKNNSVMALNTSLNLGSPVAYSLFSTCNAGFIAISKSDFEMAYKLFLSARGTYPSLDKPWLGDMLINLNNGNLTGVIQNIKYLYLLTNHRPTLNNFFMALLLLSPYLPNKYLYYMGRRYKHKSDGENLNFMNCFLSATVSCERKKYKNAVINYIIGLRTCLPFCCKHEAFINSAVQDLLLCLRQNKVCA